MTQWGNLLASFLVVHIHTVDGGHDASVLGDNGWVIEVWTRDSEGKWLVSAVQVTPAAKK